VAVPAAADWMEGDPFKMHYPQLPDPQGWDVAFDELIDQGVYRGPLGDDWKCTQTGPVDDIHFWVSFREDQGPTPNEFLAGFVQIYKNVPAGQDEPYSHPGDLLWGMGFDTKQPNVTLRPYGFGPQGWYEPYKQIVVRPDHEQYYQVNIDKIMASGGDPFMQQEGEIYWLVAHMMILDPAGVRVDGKAIGWKTSLSEQFMDDAVYGNPLPGGPVWTPLVDPYTGKSLDLAFVITGIPEPSTALLGAMAALLAASRRRSVPC
jgi:hypothetical protein